MIQARKKEIPKLSNSYDDETVQQEVKHKLLQKADNFVQCIRGKHYDEYIPEFLQPEYLFLYPESMISRVYITLNWLLSLSLKTRG